MLQATSRLVSAQQELARVHEGALRDTQGAQSHAEELEHELQAARRDAARQVAEAHKKAQEAVRRAQSVASAYV